MTTLDSWPLSSAKKEMKSLSSVVLKKGDSTLHDPKSDVESQPQSDSGEEATEQIESSRKSPVDEEWHPILPPSDVMNNTKHKSKVVKKELPMPRLSCDKERNVKRKNITLRMTRMSTLVK